MDFTILEALVSKFQRDALLGVHGVGFLGRDGEEGCIEAGDVAIHEVAALGVERTAVLGVRMVESIDVEPIFRPSAMCVLASRDHVPELVGVGGIAGEPAGNANDGNWHGTILGENSGNVVVGVIGRHDMINGLACKVSVCSVEECELRPGELDSQPPEWMTGGEQ